MATYYVATTGNDGNPGTIGQPWLTPEHAIAAVAAGDTVYYANGTYNCPSAGLKTWSEGTPGNVITHQATNSRQVTWRAIATPDNNRLLDMSNVDYVELNGIIVDAGTSLGIGNSYASRPIYLYNSTYITLDDVVSTGGKHGVVLEDGENDNITVTNCEIHPEYYNTGEFGNGFKIDGSNNTNITLHNTQIYHCDHVGLDVNGGVNGLTVTNCTFRDNHSHNASLGYPGNPAILNVLIANCVIYGSENWGDVEPGDVHSGIWLRDIIDTITIRNCEIYDNDGPGLMISDRGNDNIYVYNNTFYNNCQAPEAVNQGEIYLSSPDETTPAITIKNNIIYAGVDNVATLYGDIREDNVVIDYNCHYSDDALKIRRKNGTTYTVWATYQGAGFEANSMYDNPDMYDLPSADFNLVPGVSPCIDAGVDVGLPYSGTAPDIGANETTPSSGPVIVIVVEVSVVVVF